MVNKSLQLSFLPWKVNIIAGFVLVLLAMYWLFTMFPRESSQPHPPMGRLTTSSYIPFSTKANHMQEERTVPVGKRGDRVRKNTQAGREDMEQYGTAFNPDRFGSSSVSRPRYAEYGITIPVTGQVPAMHIDASRQQSGRLAMQFQEGEREAGSIQSSQVPAQIPLPRAKPRVSAVPTHNSNETALIADISDVPVPLSRPISNGGRNTGLSGVDENMITARAEGAQAPLPRMRPKRVAARPDAVQTTSLAAYAPAQTSLREGQASGALNRLFGPHSKGSQLLDPSSGIAVYDIQSATVHLPNGERLEAHSGLGKMRDNPDYAHVKNKGSTPPNVYDLVMREKRFHGTEAIRLLPSDGKKKYNRDGLLAHPYLYKGRGGRAQSNGCVVFSEYERFLEAFKRGNVRKLIVVPSLDELPHYIAAL